jgi:FtsP/CotA-like multicopper oxidase with cupredoxin domain
MTIGRRARLKAGGVTALWSVLPGCSRPEREATAPQSSAGYTIRIGTGLVELAPDRIIATTLYNKQFPGPLIRLKEGRPVTVDLQNDTDTPEQLHWACGCSATRATIERTEWASSSSTAARPANP